MKTTSHPILDRHPTLRDKADVLGLQCPDIDWLGWGARYRLVCRQGHFFSSVLSKLGRLKRCPVCRRCRSMERLLQHAAAAQITCLDDAWLGCNGVYRFRCSQGHEWNQAPKHLVCQTCSRAAGRRSRRLPDGLAQLQGVAAERGGTCLSSTYLGHDARHRFRCAEGHEWDTDAGSVLKGRWCALCSHEKKRVDYRLADGLARLQEAARVRGGECLSDTYQGGAQAYRFRCATGHTWQAAGSGVLLRGAWCSMCAHQRRGLAARLTDGLERLQQAAADKGGRCLSETYGGYFSAHRFHCGRGHEWETIASLVFMGSWCPECIHDSLRLGIEVARATAQARGGQCLSETYRNTKTKMTWMCHRGHVWQAAFTGIRRGTWCPQCAHMAQISNRKSRARLKYDDAGTRLFGKEAFDPGEIKE